MDTILVTGGAGFIGSNFVHYALKKRNYRIVNLDALTYAGNPDNLKDITDGKQYRFVKGNICDRELLERLFREEQFRYVINFAAESHVDRSIDTPDIFLQTNVLGTQVLLDVAKKFWNKHPGNHHSKEYRDGVKFLQVSTDEVYGALGKEGKFTESTPLQPNSPYSASKASADMMVRAYHQTYGMPVNITRCSNNYGPFQFPEKLIPLMIYNALHDISLPVYGDGLQVRDWLHVSDHCSAIAMVLEKGVPGEVYNIGGNNEKSNLEIVRLILKTLGKGEELISHVQDRPGHDRRYAIDNTKISMYLGWTPAYSFEEGISETIDWYLNHQDWVEKLVGNH